VLLASFSGWASGAALILTMGSAKDDADNGEMNYNRRDDDQDLNQRECGARKLC